MNIILLSLPCSNYLPKYSCIFIPYLFLQVKVVLAADAKVLSVSTIHVEDMESGSPLPKHLQNSTFKKVITQYHLHGVDHFVKIIIVQFNFGIYYILQLFYILYGSHILLTTHITWVKKLSMVIIDYFFFNYVILVKHFFCVLNNVITFVSFGQTDVFKHEVIVLLSMICFHCKVIGSQANIHIQIL